MEPDETPYWDEVKAWAKGHWLDLAILIMVGSLIVLAIIMQIEPPGALIWAIALLAILNHYQLSWRGRANAAS